MCSCLLTGIFQWTLTLDAVPPLTRLHQQRPSASLISRVPPYISFNQDVHVLQSRRRTFKPSHCVYFSGQMKTLKQKDSPIEEHHLLWLWLEHKHFVMKKSFHKFERHSKFFNPGNFKCLHVFHLKIELHNKRTKSFTGYGLERVFTQLAHLKH